MVDIMIPWMIYIIYFLTALCTDQIIALNNVTACYTNLDEFLELNCTVSQQIEVHELYFVTKNLNSSECKPPIANASFFDGCCSYSNDDCVVDVFTTSGKEDNYNYIFQSCTGRNGCKEKVGWIANHGACNASVYSSLSTYMLARYECISDDLIIANSSDVELTNEVIYLQNGEGTSQIACSVESTCNTTVVITAIDVNLTCDAGTINCNHNNDYRIKEIFESSDHFLQLEINVTEGHRFWIQLKANDSVSKLTVSCGAKKRNTAQNSCVESTTAITTSETSNVTTPDTVTSNVTLDTSNVTVTETSNVTTPETPVASNVTTPATSNVTTPEPATSNVTTLETVISNLTTPATSNVISSVTSNVTASEAATSSITTPATPTVTTPVTTNITASETATSSITTPATSTVATPVTSNVTTPETMTSNVTTSGTLTPNVTTPQRANQESTLPNTSEPDERTILVVVLVIGVLVIICIISLVVWFHIKQKKSFYKLPPIEMK